MSSQNSSQNNTSAVVDKPVPSFNDTGIDNVMTSPEKRDVVVAVIPFPNLTSNSDGLITVVNGITGLTRTENEDKAIERPEQIQADLNSALTEVAMRMILNIQNLKEVLKNWCQGTQSKFYTKLQILNHSLSNFIVGVLLNLQINHI